MKVVPINQSPTSSPIDSLFQDFRLDTLNLNDEKGKQAFMEDASIEYDYILVA
jgi:hypothetical protein